MVVEHVKSLLRSLYLVGVQSVNPGSLVKSILKVHCGILEVNNIKCDLNAGRCFVIGFGKAVLSMAREAEIALQSYISGGLIIVPCGCVTVRESSSVIEVCQGAEKNLPDAYSVHATSKLVSLINNLSKDDLVVCLISGGGSALLSMPRENISLEEKLSITKLLANAGANIRELNCVRKHLSSVKGGRLSEIIYPAKTLSLILSDIVGDPVDLIASGPTAESVSLLKASNIVSKYNIENKISEKILNILQEPYVVNKNVFSGVNNFIIGSNSQALRSMGDFAKSKGYETVIVSSCVEGSVETVAELYWRLARLVSEIWTASETKSNVYEEIREIVTKLGGNSIVAKTISDLAGCKKICLLAGGEPTVHIVGNGEGGRSQELALRISALAEAIPLPPQVEATFLAAGSDGIDGPTNAAGAIAYTGQATIASSVGLCPHSFISQNDSYNFFKRLNNGEDHIITGHSGTNVMDFHILVINFP